jgi:AhpD family alkylhydroperoxidase
MLLGNINQLAGHLTKVQNRELVNALSEGKLSEKLKELIAVAHTTGCPYCIEVHVKAGKLEDMTKEKLAEAILVATALKAASALAHGVNALNAYDGIDEEELYKASYFNRQKEFATLNGDAFKAFVDFDGQSLK